jgi:hypothetical protein
VDRKQRFFRVYFPPWMTSGHQIGGTVIDGELIIDIDKITGEVCLVYSEQEPGADDTANAPVLRIRLFSVQRNMYHPQGYH